MLRESNRYTCPGKVRYHWKGEADQALKEVRDNYLRERGLEYPDLMVYRCWECGLYHLGNRPAWLKEWLQENTKGTPMATGKNTKPATAVEMEETQFFLKPGYLLISPEQATRILTECLYSKQRNLRYDRVIHLSEQGKAGKWEVTGIQVCYCVESKRFYLVDGQHRLNAIIIADQALPLYLILACKNTLAEVDALYRRLDIHSPRTLQDRLRASDLAEKVDLNDWELKATSHAMAILSDGFATNSPYARKGNTVTSDDDLRIQLTQEWAPEARQFFECLKGCITKDRGKFQNGTLLAFALVTFRYQSGRASEFWRAVALNDGLERFTPEWTFRNRVFEEGQSRYTVPEYSRRMALCWNAWYEGRRKLERLILREDSVDRPIRISGTPYTFDRRIRVGTPQDGEGK